MKKLHISTEIGSIIKYATYEKAIELVAKAGFDCWDFSLFSLIEIDWDKRIIKPGTSPLNGDNYKELALLYRKIGEQNGIYCNQAHAPFPTDMPGIEPYIKRAIECASIAGAKAIVVHPCNNLSAEENAKVLRKYVDYGRKLGIKIATENMWNWNKELGHTVPAACSSPIDFLAHIEAMNDSNFVACVDVGHASIMGNSVSPSSIIEKLGNHVQCLHIHDVDLVHDNHQIPFSLKVDFEALVKSLKKIKYSGELTLECDTYLPSFNGDLEEGIKNLKFAADKLRKMFND